MTKETRSVSTTTLLIVSIAIALAVAIGDRWPTAENAGSTVLSASSSSVVDRHDDYDRKTISHWADNMKAKGKLVDYEFGPQELNLQMAPPKLDANDEATARLNYFSNEVFGARILAVDFCSYSGKHYGNWKINITFNGVLKVVGWDCTRDVN
jgi:hypothetical protein